MTFFPVVLSFLAAWSLDNPVAGPEESRLKTSLTDNFCQSRAARSVICFFDLFDFVACSAGNVPSRVRVTCKLHSSEARFQLQLRCNGVLGGARAYLKVLNSAGRRT